MHKDTRIWIANSGLDHYDYKTIHYIQYKDFGPRVYVETENDALYLEHILNPPLLREPWPQRKSLGLSKYDSARPSETLESNR